MYVHSLLLALLFLRPASACGAAPGTVYVSLQGGGHVGSPPRLVHEPARAGGEAVEVSEAG